MTNLRLNYNIFKIGLFVNDLQHFVSIIFIDDLDAIRYYLTIVNNDIRTLTHIGKLRLTMKDILIFYHQGILKFLLSCFQFLIEICNNIFNLVWVQMFEVVSWVYFVFVFRIVRVAYTFARLFWGWWWFYFYWFFSWRVEKETKHI